MHGNLTQHIANISQGYQGTTWNKHMENRKMLQKYSDQSNKHKGKKALGKQACKHLIQTQQTC